MGARRKLVWGAGFGLVLAVAAFVPGREQAPVSTPLLVFLTWFMFGLMFELAALVRSLLPSAAPPENQRVRDRPSGSSRVVPLSGIEGIPNRFRPAFQRFTKPLPATHPAPARARRTSCAGAAMTGRVALVSFFLGRHDRAWTDAEIAAVLASLERAAEWVEREAARYGTDLEIALGNAYFEAVDDQHDDVAIEVIAEAYQMGLFEARSIENVLGSTSRAAVLLGFQGVADWFERIHTYVEADHVVSLIHPCARGRSHAVPADENPLQSMRLAICYAQEADFPGPARGTIAGDSVTYAHELLHLFGALDKYDTPLSTFPKDSVTARDIMRLQQNSLTRLRVDQLTARELGWTTAAKPPGLHGKA